VDKGDGDDHNNYHSKEGEGDWALEPPLPFWKRGCNRVLLKEVVHCLDPTDRVGIFEGLRDGFLKDTDNNKEYGSPREDGGMEGDVGRASARQRRGGGDMMMETMETMEGEAHPSLSSLNPGSKLIIPSGWKHRRHGQHGGESVF
jgi:hypothetical protein